MNTAYEDPESNIVECCLKCYADVELHWAEMWRDYYSGTGVARWVPPAEAARDDAKLISDLIKWRPRFAAP